MRPRLDALRRAALRRRHRVLHEALGRSGLRGGVGVDLPPLEPGDVVDLQWRRDDLEVGKVIRTDVRDPQHVHSFLAVDSDEPESTVFVKTSKRGGILLAASEDSGTVDSFSFDLGMI